MHFSSNRRFQLWDYNVSHKQLLLRSPSSPEIAGNVDIVFWQVEYMALPTTLKEVLLASANEVERVAIKTAFGTELEASLYRLDSGGRSYFVAAGGFKVLTNHLEIFESTLVDFGIDRPREWYGDVVAHS